ncbi:hypothetical protein FJZ31_15815 [Candidatus Poribacteria bacterium]|nr:hypothetical protein [Candidatus Poribacteria bacterium]
MTISRRRAERSLKQKGFVRDNKGHRMFYLYVDGLKTPIFTCTSHGGREIDDSLLNLMKHELRLRTNRQAQDLLNCPMTGEDYVRWLREQGILR